MRRAAIVAWALCNLILLPPSAAAQTGKPTSWESIAGTPHDFGQWTKDDGTAGPQDPCAYCHTQAGTKGGPDTEESYSLYGSGAGASREPGVPGGASLLCLSCHDGSTAGEVRIRGRSNLGPDLTNDHPISVRYDDFMGAGLRSVSSALDAGLRLQRDAGGYWVECSTCHDPHNNTLGKFLRMSNNGSRMCLTCHDK
jgi:predicted CXXCH cytochrome family protein